LGIPPRGYWFETLHPNSIPVKKRWFTGFIFEFVSKQKWEGFLV